MSQDVSNGAIGGILRTGILLSNYNVLLIGYDMVLTVSGCPQSTTIGRCKACCVAQKGRRVIMNVGLMIILMGMLLLAALSLLVSHPPQTRGKSLIYAAIAVVFISIGLLYIVAHQIDKMRSQNQKECFKQLSKIVLESPKQKAEWITAIMENKTSIFGDINYCSTLDLVKAITLQEQDADN